MSAHRPSARASAHARGATPVLERSGLRLGERVVPLRSGAVHYFRLPPARWRRALESLRELGLEMVETYVPWGVHELAEGQFDFGEHDPQKNLGAFLDLAHELGLVAFLRPGPNINAELPFFGLPRRVVFDARNQARSSRGRALPLVAPPRMFPVPSYASRHFRTELDPWFQAFAAIAAPRCWPRGPVALLQIDNEAAFYFRDAPYDSDYHPDALADFERFLQRRYGAIAVLNASYASAYASFEDVPAPRRFEAAARAELPPYLDWVAFHESLLCDAVAAMRQQLAAAGMAGLPVVHNLPMGEGGLPTPISTLGRAVDLVGLDYYHNRGGFAGARRRTSRLVPNARVAFAPELGVGAPPWFAARSELDSLQGAIAACAFGLRGFNLYMAVDRDRWYGAPIDEDGELRASAEPWRRFIAALVRSEFHRLRRRVEVALCIPTEYAQLSRATHALGALSPNLLDLAGLPMSSASRSARFGFEQPIQTAWEPLLERLDEALCRAQIPFVYVENDTDLESLAELRLVIAPSYEFADAERWSRLRRFAEGGGTVVWGPQLPKLDARMQPHAFAAIGDRRPLRAADAAQAQALIGALIEELALARRFPITPYPAQSAVHEDEHGVRVIFAINPSSADLHAEIRLGAPLRVCDALTGEHIEGTSSLALGLPGQICRMLIVEEPARDQ